MEDPSLSLNVILLSKEENLRQNNSNTNNNNSCGNKWFDLKVLEW